MNPSLRFTGDVFSDLDRLQQQLDQFFRPFSGPTNIRAMARTNFPAVNVGTTPDSVEVVVFAPGIDPQALQVSVDNGLLVIAGERPAEPSAGDAAGEPANGAAGAAAERKRSIVYAQERFGGAFRRVVSLPDDADPGKVDASYRDGVLRISVAKRESSKPRRISIQ